MGNSFTRPFLRVMSGAQLVELKLLLLDTFLQTSKNTASFFKELGASGRGSAGVCVHKSNQS